MKKIRLGFIGCGFQGQNAHISQYFRLSDECELTALAEVRPVLREKVGAYYGFKELHSSHTELLEKADVDAYICVQPYVRNITLLPDILKKGKPVLTEKPIAFSPEAGAEIVRAAEKYGAPYMVGYQKRSDLASRYAKKLMDQWLASGECGKLNYIRITMPPGDWLAGGDRGCITTDESVPELDITKTEREISYFTEPQLRLYDYIVNYYSHQFDYMRFFLGEDYTVEYGDKNAKLMVVSGKTSGVTGIVEMDIYNQSVDWDEKYLICFERGYIDVHLAPPLAVNRCGTVRVYRETANGPETIIPSLPHEGPMLSQAKNFLRVARGELAPVCPAAEALFDLEVCKTYALRVVK